MKKNKFLRLIQIVENNLTWDSVTRRYDSNAVSYFGVSADGRTIYVDLSRSKDHADFYFKWGDERCAMKLVDGEKFGQVAALCRREQIEFKRRRVTS